MKGNIQCLLFIIGLLIRIQDGFGQFYPVPKTTIQQNFVSDKLNGMLVASFSLSELVTVSQFKEYLVSVKKDSTAKFYISQIPSSKVMNKKLVQAILDNDDLQNKPMPGVSWSVAQNYCKWLSATSRMKDLEFNYALPRLSELIAFNQFYKIDTSSELESWTENSYEDDDLFMFSKNSEFTYDAKSFDPPSMKRKVIYGGSYHMDYVPKSTYQHLQYEYQDSSSRYVGFRVVRRHKEHCNTYAVNDYKVNAGFENNRLHGLFQETYKNGQVKAIGEFYKGQRIGIWSVWDTTGVLKVQREYSGNRNCDFLYPAVDNPYREIYAAFPPYVLKRNKNEVYPYLYTEERAVCFSYRVWRQLSSVNEPELFQIVDFETLVKELLKKDIKWYLYGNKGNFKTPIEANELDSLKVKYTGWDFSRIEIKEDFIFNKDNLLSDVRQLGISFYKNKEDKNPAYLIYYPQIRSELAKIKMSVSSVNEITNLEDFFFFGAYRGEIVKHSGFSKNYEVDNKLRDLEFEIEKLTIEHNLWISFGR